MNKPLLLSMLESAGQSYGKYQSIRPNETLIEINSEKSDVQAFIRISNNIMLITFRGTDSFKDVITDLRFCRKIIPYGNNESKIRVHSGFLDTYKCKDVRDVIHSYINDDIDRICVSGHSYGAALACLCAIDLQYNYPRKDYEVSLFGCPRVGNAAFKKSYNKRLFKTIRVENGNDIITKIPFCWLGYRHVGSKVHVGMPRIVGYADFKQHKAQAYYAKIFKMQ